MGDRTDTPPNSPKAKKIVFILFFLIVAVSVFLFVAAFQQTQGVLMEFTRFEGISSVRLAAQMIDGDVLAGLKPGDEQTAAYAVIRNNLNRIRTTRTSATFTP